MVFDSSFITAPPAPDKAPAAYRASEPLRRHLPRQRHTAGWAAEHAAGPAMRTAEDPVRVARPGKTRTGSTSRGECFPAGYGKHRNHSAGCRDRKSTRLNSSHANISYAV